VIVLDTSVLVYAVGGDHPLRDPSRRVIDAVAKGLLRATTSAEVVQEFAHVRAQRRPRADAVRLARSFRDLLSPLLAVVEEDVEAGLQLFQKHERLGAFDALLAAAALREQADGLISGDVAFGAISGLRFVQLGSPELDGVLAG
jgi:predicted nucleic acid-binding protein